MPYFCVGRSINRPCDVDGLSQCYGCLLGEQHPTLYYSKPHYPVPAIAMSVKWIGDVANPFYGISIRDNAGKGWANFTWSPAYGWEYHPREQWQCEYCGGYHRSEDCTI